MLSPNPDYADKIDNFLRDKFAGNFCYIDGRNSSILIRSDRDHSQIRDTFNIGTDGSLFMDALVGEYDFISGYVGKGVVAFIAGKDKKDREPYNIHDKTLDYTKLSDDAAVASRVDDVRRHYEATGHIPEGYAVLNGVLNPIPYYHTGPG